MPLDQFLAEYAGAILGSFGLGFSCSVLITYTKKYFEQI